MPGQCSVRGGLPQEQAPDTLGVVGQDLVCGPVLRSIRRQVIANQLNAVSSRVPRIEVGERLINRVRSGQLARTQRVREPVLLIRRPSVRVDLRR